MNQDTTDYPFQNNSKFALLTVNSVYTDLPRTAFQLSDGTSVLPCLPDSNLGIWKQWLGSSRTERLSSANLVLLVEEPSGNPEILDDTHQRLGKALSDLFFMMHLGIGLEVAEGADLLYGSSENRVPIIRQMTKMPAFRHSKGWKRAPVTRDWLEDALILRAAVTTMDADQSQFRRAIRGLVTLFKGLKETGQDRLHQFVRSLEALVLPDIGSTKRQFAHRCQTFARSCDDTRTLLIEAFDMRSDTEHLNSWDGAVQSYPTKQREDVCWQRTRQIEHLACEAYSRVLRDATLREHFRTEAAMAAFWGLPDDRRLALWGTSLDITQEPFVQKYDRWERAIAPP